MLETFRTVEILKGFRVSPKNIQLARTLESMQSVWLKRARISNVVPSSDPTLKLLLLKSDVTDEEIASSRDVLQKNDISAEVETYELTVDYEQLSAEEAIRLVLPDDVEVPTSFETIGHLAHFNLKESHWPHRTTIGQIILDKNTHLRTVVTKVGILKNTFRTFDMEVIAGVDCTECTTKEMGMTFMFDFRKVYWNGRLCGERDRLLAKMEPTNVLLDAFAGVGALSCFAAKKGLKVVANDLNPDAVSALKANAKRNNVDVTTFNIDAREFLRKMLREQPWAPAARVHIVMNLPCDALEFLDVFQDRDLRLPNVYIYCHCFAKSTPPADEIYPRLELALGYIPSAVEIADIRRVSTNKQMHCVEFELDSDQKRRRVMKATDLN